MSSKPVLCYDCAKRAPTKQQLSRIEAFHLKQRRALIGIVFPNQIRNERLYESTGAVPLGMVIFRARWRLFEHILRLPADSPPSLAMGAYFTEPRPAGWIGRPRHTLPRDDAKRIGLSLSSKADLEAFRALAADGSGWAGICAREVWAHQFVFISHNILDIMSSFFCTCSGLLYLFEVAYGNTFGWFAKYFRAHQCSCRPC